MVFAPCEALSRAEVSQGVLEQPVADHIDVSDLKKKRSGCSRKARALRRAALPSAVTVLEAPAAGEDAVRVAAKLALDQLGTCKDEPVLLVNLGRVDDQLRLWRHFLPQVRPHYAMKCNPDKELLKQIWSNGCGFDCATMAEIQTVLSMGVKPDDIVYSHPCKPRSHVAYARSKGVLKMSFDNAGELRKVAQEFPEAHLLLRLVCDDASSLCPMSMKFGASRNVWAELLDLMMQLKLHFAGIHFHVGSGCKDPESFEKALRDAREVFHMAAERGLKPDVLDIGGGFPGDKASFAKVAPQVAEKLARLFPSSDFPSLRIIAEPGRFLACGSAHLLTKCIAKAKLSDQDGREVCRYYLNDGLYGSFNCIIFDHACVKPELVEEKSAEMPQVPCALFGPTCDGFDVILEKHCMPELSEGDWLLWRNMGAYTSAAGSEFNGFPLPSAWYYRNQAAEDEEPALIAMAFRQEDEDSQYSCHLSTESTDLEPSPVASDDGSRE